MGAGRSSPGPTVTWFPPRNGEARVHQATSLRLQPKTNVITPVTSSQILREGNTLWFMINSKLAGGANSFPSNLAVLQGTYIHRQVPEVSRWLLFLKITLTPLGLMGKVRLHDGYLGLQYFRTFLDSGCAPLSAPTLLCSSSSE